MTAVRLLSAQSQLIGLFRSENTSHAVRETRHYGNYHFAHAPVV